MRRLGATKNYMWVNRFPNVDGHSHINRMDALVWNVGLSPFHDREPKIWVKSRCNPIYISPRTFFHYVKRNNRGQRIKYRAIRR